MPTGRCLLCPCDVPEATIVDHVTRTHPDRLDSMETWPDGRPVILDATLLPNDFTHARERA